MDCHLARPTQLIREAGHRRLNRNLLTPILLLFMEEKTFTVITEERRNKPLDFISGWSQKVLCGWRGDY